MRKYLLASATVLAKVIKETQATELKRPATVPSTEARTTSSSNMEKWQAFNMDFESANQTTDCDIKGKVPEWLKGSLYRNGPGIFKGQEGPKWNHFFDGLCVLHCWSVENKNGEAKISYKSKALNTEQYGKCFKYNRMVGLNFGSNLPDPCKSCFNRFFTYFCPRPPSEFDNTAVSIVELDDRLFALTEGLSVHEVNPADLSSKRKLNANETIALHMGTAHPHQEADGSMIYFGTMFNYRSAYNFIRIPPPSQIEGKEKGRKDRLLGEKTEEKSPFENAKIMAQAPSRWYFNMSYTHSFGMTENYLVHLEQPVAMNMFTILSLNWLGRRKSVEDAMSVYNDQPTMILVINKRTGKMHPVRFEAPTGFVFHFINCYEEDNHIVCDVCFYDDPKIVKDLYVDSILGHMNGDAQSRPKVSNSYYRRFVLPLGKVDGKKVGENLVTLDYTTARASRKNESNVVRVEPEHLFQDTQGQDEYVFELPRINYKFNTKKYRYAYGTTVFNVDTRRLMKFDTVDKKVKVWDCDDHHMPGEPVFVARPGASEEDDGVILCPILADTTDHPSFLLILDGKTFEQLAKAEVPKLSEHGYEKMNWTFHGNFSHI